MTDLGHSKALRSGCSKLGGVNSAKMVAAHGAQVVCLSMLLAFARLGYSQTALPRADHAAWDTLLKEFVNAQHRVDYARLKKEGSETLKAYIANLGRAPTGPLPSDERKATLINAYNGFTIEWVVDNYPVQSIWSTLAPFTRARHTLGGKKVSLDELESQLRAMGDPRVHAALVCAARSCPPLRREAYVAERLDEQLDDNACEWLADPSLNTFYPGQAKAEISPIFKWYDKDFDSYPGDLEGFLRQYAPPGVKEALGDRKPRIQFKDYDWGLNDQSKLGEDYSQLQFAVDRIRNWFLSLAQK